MQTIAINSDNDIYINAAGNLVIKTDLNAMGDIITNKSQTNINELLYNTEKGIDFFNTIFASPYYPDLFQVEVTAQIEDTDAVQKITNFSFEENDGIFSYMAKIQTDYGVIALNG